MVLKLLSGGCNLPGCPAVWEDDTDLASAIVVGETVTDPAVLGQLDLSPGECAVRAPRVTLAQGVARLRS